MMKIIRILLVMCVSLALLLSLLIYFTTYHPSEIEIQEVYSPEQIPRIQPGQTIKIMNWNVQFMAGNHDNHFFYDDGTDPWPSKASIEQTLDGIARVIQQQAPDIVLLQEVDDVASRTHRQDQTQALLSRLPDYTAFTQTFYWKAAYVPHPDINGRVGMKLVVLSKYALSKATRIALPAITTDDILRRQFNLKRAMQQVHLPIEGGGELVVINTHLSAFAKGSNTMTLQVAKVMEQLTSLGSDAHWIIGGDFNLLPNDAAIASFTEQRSHYNEQGTELTPLITTYSSIPSLENIQRDPEPWFTYISPSSTEKLPSRTIDYIFYSPTLENTQSNVLRGEALALSDHLPIVASFKL